MAEGRRTRSHEPVSAILVRQGVITEAQVEAARAAGASSDRNIVEALAEKGKITGDDVARALAERHGCQYTDLEGLAIQPDVRAAIDRRYQLQKEIVPIEMTDISLTVCTADPSDINTRIELEQMTGKMVKVVVSSAERVKAAIRGKMRGAGSRDDEEKRTQELNLDAAWKLFDKEDRPKSAETYGGKAKQLSKDSCVIEGTLPGGEELRQLTFRKYVMKLNVFLRPDEEPVRAIGQIQSKGVATEDGKLRYEVAFTKLAEGDESRIQEFLASL